MKKKKKKSTYHTATTTQHAEHDTHCPYCTHNLTRSIQQTQSTPDTQHRSHSTNRTGTGRKSHHPKPTPEITQVQSTRRLTLAHRCATSHHLIPFLPNPPCPRVSPPTMHERRSGSRRHDAVAAVASRTPKSSPSPLVTVNAAKQDRICGRITYRLT